MKGWAPEKKNAWNPFANYDNLKQVQSRCPMCQKCHDLYACYSYKNTDVGERRRFQMKQKLCFGSYEPTSKDHSERNWQRRRTCCVQRKLSNRTAVIQAKEQRTNGRKESKQRRKINWWWKKIACASTTNQEDTISMCVINRYSKAWRFQFCLWHHWNVGYSNCSEECWNVKIKN